mmetsp:Transcript_36226/g.102010  ORF Transcript_36226/g.102010 Transcript_36226/m.102010 type:complete len:208 (+) Transcript_36226:2380-3003(+)
MLSIMVVTDLSRRCRDLRRKVARPFSPPSSRYFDSSSAGASEASRPWKYPTIREICALACAVSTTLRTRIWLRKNSRRSSRMSCMVSWFMGGSSRSSTGSPSRLSCAGASASQNVFFPSRRLISRDGSLHGCGCNAGISASSTAPRPAPPANIPAICSAMASCDRLLSKSTSVATDWVLSCSTDARALVSGLACFEVKRRTARASMS